VWVRNISLEILCFISDEQTIKISQAFTQKDEVQNDVMFSGEFGPEFDDCTKNSSQIRESCSGDRLLATTYVLWVIQEQA